jgi:O-methyltransferase involved in polyketide biosynthesis
MLMTLHGRAVQSQWKDPILRDPWAVDAMQHIDYDTSKLDNMGGIFAPFVADLGCKIIATRASTFDMLTNSYLTDHPDATVLHLGCGMDSRAFRINPPASVQWYDVDYPDVIDLRKNLFPERPAYHLIGAPLDDLHWLDEVPGNRPVLVIAEGVLMYLSEAEVKALLNTVVGHFPNGRMIFDAVHPMILKRTGSNVGGTGATYKWSLNDPQDIKQLEPKLEPVKEFRTPDLVGFSRFPLLIRALMRAIEVSTALRRMDRILIYRF